MVYSVGDFKMFNYGGSKFCLKKKIKIKCVLKNKLDETNYL